MALDLLSSTAASSSPIVRRMHVPFHRRYRASPVAAAHTWKVERSVSAHHFYTLSSSLQSTFEGLPRLTILVTVRCPHSDSSHFGWTLLSFILLNYLHHKARHETANLDLVWNDVSHPGVIRRSHARPLRQHPRIMHASQHHQTLCSSSTLAKH